MESARAIVYHPKIDLPIRQAIITPIGDKGCECGNHTVVDPTRKTLGVDCEHEPGFGMFLVGVCVLASGFVFLSQAVTWLGIGHSRHFWNPRSEIGVSSCVAIFTTDVRSRKE